MKAYEYSRKIYANTLPSMRYDGSEDFSAWQKKAYDKLWELLGLDEFEKCDDCMNVEYIKEHDDYIEKRFTFFSEEGYRVPCHILFPKNVQPPYKPVICMQGHSTGMHISLGIAKFPGDESSINDGDRDFAIRAVKEGYAPIAIEQRYMGECGGNKENGKPGCISGNACNTTLVGRCAIGERVWDVSRLIDVLEKYFDNLDMDKLVCLGNSGGGTTTFYSACIDKRIKCAVPSCSVCTFGHSIVAMHHCHCNYIPGIGKYFDMGDMAGLIAPRKLVVVNGKEDSIFPIEGVDECMETAYKMYDAAGARENVCNVTGDGGHRFYADIAWEKINCFLSH